MDELAQVLMQRVYIDFSGGLTLDQVRAYLRRDDSPEARALLAKLIEERSIDDMMITIADCLKDHLRTGIDEAVIREQLVSYGES